MKNQRIKPPTITRDDAERLVNEIATEESTRRQLAAAMDEQILAIRADYGPQLEAHGASIKANTQLVQAWADSNPAEFSKRKSIDFPAGRVGYRTGTPKAKTRAGFTWARVIEKLKSLAWGEAFLRISEEVAKDEIIAATTQGRLSANELISIGVTVVQDETFFVEPDLTAVQERITANA